jgi:hypothetical protein
MSEPNWRQGPPDAVESMVWLVKFTLPAGEMTGIANRVGAGMWEISVIYEASDGVESMAIPLADDNPKWADVMVAVPDEQEETDR